MKVLFLSPPQRDKLFPSLGIAYIVAVLNKNGHNAFLNDGANQSFADLIDYVDKIKPEVVGITLNTTNRFDALGLAKTIKSKFKVPIIFGGPHATLLSTQMLENYSFIDFIVRNEGEYSTLELINSLEKGEKDYTKILGISYRKNGEIINNPPSKPIENLDDLPFPEWKFFNLDNYVKENEYPEEYKKYPHGTIISSRGCPFQCTFCSSSNFWGFKIRFRSAANVIKEIKMLYDLGIRFFAYNDDNFTSNKTRAIEICKMMVEEGLHEKMSWLCRAEVNTINEELLVWMKKANCFMIEFGIEDCSDDGLKWFKKGHRKDMVKKAFDLCKKYDIRIRSYFIIGGDHETIENVEMKKQYIEELDPYTTTASILLAYPGTEIFELGKKKGFWDDSVWLTNCVGEKYHSRAPIYTGPNLSYAELSAASADILYWWGKKKGHYKLVDNIKIAFGLFKRGDFSKFFNMSYAVLKQKIRR